MASAIVLSGVVALTLTPVLCAMILKIHMVNLKEKLQLIFLLIGSITSLKNNRKIYGFIKIDCPSQSDYLWYIHRICIWNFGVNKILPAGFIPNEDQGMIYAIIQTPPGATLERTNAISRKLQEAAEEVDGIQSVSSLAGYEILTEGRGSNAGTCIINLKDWSERHHSVKEIIEELEEKPKTLALLLNILNRLQYPDMDLQMVFHSACSIKIPR